MATKADDAHKHALQLMGKLIGADVKRDAVHIAVCPVFNASMSNLFPGEHVSWHPDENGHGVRGVRQRECGPLSKEIGIVDPYLRSPVRPRERFLLFLYPMTTTSLRHQWTHPDFPEEDAVSAVSTAPKSESEEWIRNWLKTSQLDHVPYEKFMEAFATPGQYFNLDGGEVGYDYIMVCENCIASGGSDAHGNIPAVEELCDHVENVLGKKLRTRPEYFSCSC